MNFYDIIVKRSEQKFVTFSPLNMTRLISIAAEKTRLILFQLYLLMQTNLGNVKKVKKTQRITTFKTH
jgi:hypothetical protein